MISLVVIAKEFSEDLVRCINSCTGVVQEVILVIENDSEFEESKFDNLMNIRKFVNKFTNFSDQKNFGNIKAENKWILSLDSDELLSINLIDEIKNCDFSSKITAFSMPRQNIFFGKKIRFTNWNPEEDRKIRLFKKECSKWVGDVHEQLAIDGKIVKLKNPIYHYAYRDMESFIEKMNLYTSSEKKFTFPVYEFVRRYFIRLGFIDGLLGLFMSYMMVIYHTTAWVKIWLKRNH